MEPLATFDDVNVRLGRDGSADVDRISALLIDASAAVRSYTGQQFTAATETRRLRVRSHPNTPIEPSGHFVILPQRPVTAVASVLSVAGSAIPFVWDGEGYTGPGNYDRVYLWANLYGAQGDWQTQYPRPLRDRVDVTYTHGYATIPDEIVGVVCQIVGRALGTTPDSSALTDETLGSYSYRIGAAAASGAFGMLPAETAILDGYKRPAGSIKVRS